jgi:hypothetical protein
MQQRPSTNPAERSRLAWLRIATARRPAAGLAGSVAVWLMRSPCPLAEAFWGC